MICVCSNLMTPCSFSISISRPMSWSFSASYTALSLDLSLAFISGKTIAKFLDTQTSRFQTGYSGFKFFQTSQFLQEFYTLKRLQASCRSPHCPNTSLVSPGPTPNLSLLIKSLTYFSLLISRQVVGVLIVQTPHLCLQDSLPTSACRDILKHPKKIVSGNQLTSHFHQMT